MDENHKNATHQSEQGFFCIENVFLSNRSYIGVGDLIATTRGIYYIRYHEFHFQRDIERDLNDLLNPPLNIGGLIDVSRISPRSFGDLLRGGASPVEQKQIDDMLSEAADMRTNLFGMAMDERLSGHQGSFFIPRETITHLEVDVSAKLIQLSYKDTTVECYASVSKMNAKELRDFVDGAAIPKGIHGIDVTFPWPSDVLKTLASNNDIGKDLALFEAMAKNKAYLDNLHYAFSKLQESEKAAVCRGLERTPWVFSSSLNNIIVDDISGQRTQALLYGLFSLIGMAVAGFFSLDTLFDESFEIERTRDAGQMILFGLVSVGCLCYTIKNLRKFLEHSLKMKRFHQHFKI